VADRLSKRDGIVGNRVTQVLTDTLNDIWVQDFERAGPAVSGAPAWSVRKRTLRGGVSDGVDVVEVDNGALSFTVLPTRGMGIWRGVYKGLSLGWRSPVRGPVHPAFVNRQERDGLGWLRGFDEMVARCGLESNGAPCRDTVTNNMGLPVDVCLTLHGAIANTPATFVQVEVSDDDPAQITVSGTVVETGLFLPQLALTTRIGTRVGANSLVIVDEIANLRATDAEMELLYHCNFGPPFLEKGSVLEVPARLVAPRDQRSAEGIHGFDTYLDPTPGYVEQCYWYETLGTDDGNTCAMLRNATSDKAVVMRFNRNELPCFTQWKNTASVEDGYVTGMEPGTNFPNAKPFERAAGRVVKLGPGSRYRVRLEIEVLDSPSQVTKVHGEIAAMQRRAERIVSQGPRSELSGT
jgi:hypothetical protein